MKTEEIQLNKPNTALIEKWPLSSNVDITVMIMMSVSCLTYIMGQR
jgi:hypothetical protein